MLLPRQPVCCFLVSLLISLLSVSLFLLLGVNGRELIALDNF